MSVELKLILMMPFSILAGVITGLYVAVNSNVVEDTGNVSMTAAVGSESVRGGSTPLRVGKLRVGNDRRVQYTVPAWALYSQELTDEQL